MAIERPTYQVKVNEDPFKLRSYANLIVAITNESDLSGNSGFGEVFDYIQGNNAQRKKIAMTVPVINELDPTKMTTAFVMPKAYGMDDLPEPGRRNLKLKEVPQRTIAVVNFSGNVSMTKIQAKKDELLKWIEAKGWIGIGSIELARYNPPFIPGFLKHNELWIEVLIKE